MRLIRGHLRFKQNGCSGSDAGVGARFTQLIERAIRGGAGQNRTADSLIFRKRPLLAHNPTTPHNTPFFIASRRTTCQGTPTETAPDCSRIARATGVLTEH